MWLAEGRRKGEELRRRDYAQREGKGRGAVPLKKGLKARLSRGKRKGLVMFRNESSPKRRLAAKESSGQRKGW